MLKRVHLLLSIVLVSILLLSSCASENSPSSTPKEKGAKPTGSTEQSAPVSIKDLITWFPYDQENTDPASDERVGNQYLRDAIPMFNEVYQGRWNWVNVPKAFDKLSTELVAAHIAGGDVPDLIETMRNQRYADNGVLMDLTDWAKAQQWYQHLDPDAVATCTIDGKLLCLPVAERPNLTYVWKDRYPNGYPATVEEFLREAERLKGEGKYAITFFGSTAFNGNAFARGTWDIVSSFGGRYDDGNGNMMLTSPETMAAIQFLRDIVAMGYVPEVAFAGGFQEEEAFKDSSAGAFPTGLFGYRYLNPLTAPDGTRYEKKTSNDMLDAIAAGDIYLAPSFATTGKTPGCGISVSGLAIPVRAKNPDAAKEFIHWIMSDANVNTEYVLSIGAGFPANQRYLSHPAYQVPFYQQAAEVIGKSACRPAEGSMKRREEAALIITNVIYKLIKEDPSADIETELKKAEEEYNQNH